MARFRSYLIFLFLLVLYLNHYLFTLGYRPILGDDSYVGILPNEPNLLLSIDKQGKKEFGPFSFEQSIPTPTGFHRSDYIPNLFLQLGDEKIPFMFQDRQGGIPIYLMGLLERSLGLKIAIWVYQIVTSILVLILFFFLIRRFYSIELSYLCLLALCLDPIFIFQYAPFISEIWLVILGLAAANIYVYKFKYAHWSVALILALGFYVKISFIWFVMCLAVFIWPKRKTKEVSHLIVNTLICSLPIFFLYDFKSIIGRYSSQLLDTKTVAHYPLRELYNLVAGKFEYLQLFVQESYPKLAEGLAFKYWGVSPWGCMALFFFAFPFLRGLKNEGKLKKVLLIYLSGSVFFLLMWMSLPRSTYYAEYLFPLILLVNLLVCLGVYEFKEWLEEKNFKRAKMIVIFLFSLVTLVPCVRFALHYRKEGPIASYDFNLLSQVVSNFQDQKVLKPFVNDELLTGKLELLSQYKIRPIHTYVYTLRYNLYNTAHLLKILKSGEMLYTLYDSLTPRGDQFDRHETPAVIRMMAKSNQTRIYAEKMIYRHGKPAFWYFKFEDQE